MPLIKSITAVDSSILPNSVAALSLLAVATGAYSFVSPLETISHFGLSLPRPQDKSPMDLVSALTRVYGVRNLSMGLTNLALWYNTYTSTGPAKVVWRHALGWAMILNLATPIIDGLMCEVQANTSGWKHWFFAPIAATLGAGLLLEL